MAELKLGPTKTRLARPERRPCASPVPQILLDGASVACFKARRAARDSSRVSAPSSDLPCGRKRRRRHAELADAEADEQRQQRRIRRHLAAHRQRDALARRRARQPQSTRSSAGCSGSTAAHALVRPIDRQQVLSRDRWCRARGSRPPRASRSAVSAAAGTSIIAPIGTGAASARLACAQRLACLDRASAAPHALPDASSRTAAGCAAVPCAAARSIARNCVWKISGRARPRRMPRSPSGCDARSTSARAARRSSASACAVVDVERPDRDRSRRHGRDHAPVHRRLRVFAGRSVSPDCRAASRNSDRNSPMPSAPARRAAATSSKRSTLASSLTRTPSRVAPRRTAGTRSAAWAAVRSASTASQRRQLGVGRADDQLARRAVERHEAPGRDALVAVVQADDGRDAERTREDRGVRRAAAGVDGEAADAGPVESARPPTAAARRRRRRTARRCRAAGRAARDAALAQVHPQRGPTRSATSPLRSRRYGSSIASNSCAELVERALDRPLGVDALARGRCAAARPTQHRVVEHQQLRVEHAARGPRRAARRRARMPSSCSRERLAGCRSSRRARAPRVPARPVAHTAPRCIEQHGAADRHARATADARQALHSVLAEAGLDQRAQRVDRRRARPRPRRRS